MKILFVSPYFFPFVGGAENHLLRICSELKELNHEIIVFTSTKNSQSNKKMKIIVSPPLFTYSNTPFNFWENQINKVIEEEKPDVVVGSLSTPFMADFSAVITEKKRIPFFLMYYNDFIPKNFFEKVFLEFYRFFFMNKTLNSADKIIVLSEYYAKNSSVLNPFSKKISVVSPFLRLREFNSLNEYKKTFPENKVVLFVGALNKGQNYKGLNYLIKAVSLVKKIFPEIKLVVVGKGNNMNYFRKLAEKKGVQSNVFFAGEISQKKLLSFYSECKTLVLPSVNDSEGFGLVFLEAMAFSKPVIGTTAGGIPAIVKHNFNGFLVEPKNEAKLSKAIEFILENEKKEKKMGENGFNYLKKFSSKKSINKLIKLFESALNEKKQ